MQALNALSTICPDPHAFRTRAALTVSGVHMQLCFMRDQAKRAMT